MLAVKVKTAVCKKYVIDTSIKHPISSQSLPLVKRYMDIMFVMVDTAF